MESLYSLEHAHFYDAFHATYVADHAFYLKTAKKHGQPPRSVLEIACGTGRLGMRLVEAGCRYRGIDLSAGMLSLFRQKWRASGRTGAAPVVRADMRKFRLGSRFDLVLITFNSLQHLHRCADLLKTFSACRAHLKKGGRFVFDVFNPDLRILSRDPLGRYPVQKFFDEGRGQWCTVEESNRYDAADQVNRIEWHYRYEKGGQGTFRLEMRQFFPQEMDMLIETAGFRTLNKWGDFCGSTFGSASPRQVFECVVSNQPTGIARRIRR